MKFNMQELPDRINREGVLVGDVYPAKGGRGGVFFWMVVATNGRMAAALGLDREGNIISATNYSVDTYASRTLLGRCEELVDFQPKIDWYDD